MTSATWSSRSDSERGFCVLAATCVHVRSERRDSRPSGVFNQSIYQLRQGYLPYIPIISSRPNPWPPSQPLVPHNTRFRQLLLDTSSYVILQTPLLQDDSVLHESLHRPVSKVHFFTSMQYHIKYVAMSHSWPAATCVTRCGRGMVVHSARVGWVPSNSPDGDIPLVAHHRRSRSLHSPCAAPPEALRRVLCRPPPCFLCRCALRSILKITVVNIKRCASLWIFYWNFFLYCQTYCAYIIVTHMHIYIVW